MRYRADTVAIVRYLRAHPALGKQAAKLLRSADQGDHHIYLSAISLMEVMYLSEAKRVDVRVDDLIELVSHSANYEIVPVGAEIVSVATGIDDVPDLHDRMIAASASWLGVPILTSDAVMSRSRHVNTIW
jgi:PIN domain nuclease of toxin-antitoxin system